MFNKPILGLLCLVCWAAGALAQCECANQNFRSLCDSSNRREEILFGSDVNLVCPVGETVTHRLLAADVTDMTQDLVTFNTDDGSKYFRDASTFQITNLQPEDEGLYQCTAATMTFCVLVINIAEFASCPTPTPPCNEVVDVFRGDSVTFDTRLRFDSSSECKCNQEIRTFSFFSALAINGMVIVYSCQNITCQNTSGIFERIGMPYNFSLTIPPLPVEMNMTDFSLLVRSVVPPASVVPIVKMFTVRISDPPPDPMTTGTEPSTTTPTTDPTVNTMSNIAIGVTMASVLLVLFGVGSIVLAICLYRRCTRNHNITKRPPKSDEVIYSEIDDKRGSKAYSSFKGGVPPDLSPTLESVSVTA